MLAQEVASRNPGRVRFVEENFGDSDLADRFGVEQYPAIFVDEALIANPWDFVDWPGTPRGRYVPWLEASSREKFVRDLETFVKRRLAGVSIESVDAPSDSVMGEDELVAQFGPVLAVPTLMVFGPNGKTAAVFYGAPPDLHDRVKRLVEELNR